MQSGGSHRAAAQQSALAAVLAEVKAQADGTAADTELSNSIVFSVGA